MSEKSYKKTIYHYLRGKLSEERELQLFNRIKESPENREIFDAVQRAKEQKMVKSPQEETIHSWQRFQNCIQPRGAYEHMSISKKRTLYFSNAFKIAASLLLGLIASYLLIKKMDPPMIQSIADQKIVTPYGARTRFILPDSSIVWVNSGSEVLFPMQFGEKRELFVTGEVCIEVKKDKKPFIVSTRYGDVEATGTRFNVKAYRDDHFETTLVEGEVIIHPKKEDSSFLRPGYQATKSPLGLQIQQVDPRLFTSWTEGVLIFRKEPLPGMAKKLERWYNVKIELDNDQRLNDIRFTCTIEMESFSEVLNLLKITSAVDFTWDEKTRVIKLFYKKKT